MLGFPNRVCRLVCVWIQIQKYATFMVLVLNCSSFFVILIVRGYVTGSTDTSLWTVYKKGVRNYCGNELSDGTETLSLPFISLASHKITNILILKCCRISKKPEASS